MMKTLAWSEFKFGIQWEDNRWDGPLSGAAVLDGKRVYFKMISETYGRKATRTFGVYELPDSEWEKIDQQHKDFCEHVGLHTNYVNGERGPHILRPEREWCKFYDKYKGLTDVKPSKESMIAVVLWR